MAAGLITAGWLPNREGGKTRNVHLESYGKNDAKSLKEIAIEMGLDISSYIDWIRVERRLSSSLRSLTRWGLVALERRQREEGHKFWYNAYWKTELAKQSEENMLS